MDCMEAMKQMPDKAYDLAIIDPPYRDVNQPTEDMRINGMIKNFGKKPDADYFKQLFRVSVNQIVWGQIILLYQSIKVLLFGVS